ncbi:MAG TPA: hypothetical protein VGR71_18395, partial [Nitrospira sp.]|nr:hypothetical protein [Nitrospira sp.]
MTTVVQALRLVKENFSERLDVTIDSAVARHEALMSPFYPSFDTELKVEQNYSICGISDIQGKTVARVEYGWRKRNIRLHDSEMLVLYFTDGSRMAIHTGSNVG